MHSTLYTSFMICNDIEKQSFLSGELARLAGVSTDTLRHYERKGVLPTPSRSRNGYRRYAAESLERVRMVRSALAIGFTLAELAKILKARNAGRAPCREVRDLAAQKLDKVQAQLTDLAVLRDELKATLRDWDSLLLQTGSERRAGLLESLAKRDGTKSKRSQRPKRAFTTGSR
jgi:DNA-binding transcriptional MerR regulator